MTNNNYNETIHEEDFEDMDLQEPTSTPNRRSRRAKKGNKATALLIAAALTVGAIGAIGVTHAVESASDYKRADKLTGTYQSGSYCIVPERIFTSQNHDFVYTSGNHLTEAAENNKIDILKVGDVFVTRDASPVARVILEIETVETLDIIKCESHGQEFYIEPVGYTWNNETQKCEKTTTEVIERYVFANSDHNYMNVRVPGSKVISVIEYQEYTSISYEEAENMKLIADVNDDYVKTDSSVVTEARLVLAPNTQK